MFSFHYYCPRLRVIHYPPIQKPSWLHPTRQRPHGLNSELHQVHVAVARSTLAISINRRVRQIYTRKQRCFQDGRVVVFYHLFVFTIGQTIVFSQEINVHFWLEDHLEDHLPFQFHLKLTQFMFSQTTQCRKHNCTMSYDNQEMHLCIPDQNKSKTVVHLQSSLLDSRRLYTSKECRNCRTSKGYLPHKIQATPTCHIP